MIDPGELVVSNNNSYQYSPSKQRRQGINNNWDNNSFRSALRSSSGTTRTISGYFPNIGTIVGDRITVAGAASSDYNGGFMAVTAVSSNNKSGGTVDISTDTITLNTHGYSDGQAVFYINDSQPIGGLESGRFYFIVASTTNTFQLALTPGGAAIDLTSVSTGTDFYNRNTVSYTAVGSLSESATVDYDAYLNNKVVGGKEFWFGSSDTKTQYLITVLDNGSVYRTSSGSTTRILDGGRAWTIPSEGLTEAHLEVFTNRIFIGVSGATNQGKYWDGSTANPLRDVPQVLNLTSVSRASSGTTRTLVMSGNVTLANGSTFVVVSSVANYAGTYTLLSGSGTATITYTAANSLSETTTADTAIRIGAVGPLALFYREHNNRLQSNDKANLDRVHYSEIEDPLMWNGVGTSGARDVGLGDGDPQGLTGFAPSFKGDLYVGKRTKLYRLSGFDPDDWAEHTQSAGIGFLSHSCLVPVDQDDVLFVSDRGVHSLAATNAYGDFEAYFLSKKIQPTFIRNWTPQRRRYVKAVYLPNENSVLYVVSYNGSSVNNSVWLYNIELKYWSYWLNVECESILTSQDVDLKRVYFGTYRGRLAQGYDGEYWDRDYEGGRVPIMSEQTTGRMFPDGRPDTIKGFKKLGIVFSTSGSYNLTATAKIDNYAEQAISFDSNSGGGVLGAFVLGEDILGGETILTPYTLPIDGFGRGIQISVQQNDLNAPIEIQGIIIEYEPAGDQQESDPEGE